jgi:TolB protein
MPQLNYHAKLLSSVLMLMKKYNSQCVQLCRLVGLIAVLMGATLAKAQLRVEVTGVGAQQIPVSIASFEGQASVPQPVTDIIVADLMRAGSFKTMASAASSEAKQPDFNSLKNAGTDAYVAGSVAKLANGQFDVRFRLWDVVKGAELAGQSYTVAPNDLRMAAHKIADVIHEKLTGIPGAFASRIAYVAKSGSRYALVVADSDGENSAEALRSNEPIISPAWSPTGGEIAYVSFESRKPVVYVHNVASGQRRSIANFKGINSAPAWAPDGHSLAVALSKDGLTQLYSIDSNGGSLRRLTQSSGIDTEPWYSSNGSLYFVSDRGGGPQVYRMPAGGGDAQRVTFTGAYNISPSVSTDGRMLAYISRQSGFKLYVQPIDGGAPVALTSTAHDESPSFAPNGKMVLYATREGGREVLATTTTDGRVKARLSAAAGDIREPAWGPILR